MKSTSLGDLAQTFMLQRRNGLLKQEIQKLTTELSSGQVADVKDVLAGNLSYLSEMDHSLETLKGYSVATTEAQLFSGSIQSALDRVYEMNERLAGDLLLAGNSAAGVGAGDPSNQSRETAHAMLDMLNASSAGRSLFAGISTDTVPMNSLDDLLDGVRTAIAGATTPDDIILAAQAWVNAPGGYAATMYQASDTSLAAFQLSPSDTVQLDIRGDNTTFGTLLVTAALSAIANEPGLGLNNAQITELHGKNAVALLSAQGELISMRGEVGFAEGRIEEIAARNAAEKTSLTYARQELLAVDPFETATRLEDVQFQLQSLYAVTVRSSQLSLVNYL